MLTSLFQILYVQSSLPDFWKAIALRLWPAYYDPEVTTKKRTIDDNITIMIHQRPSGCALTPALIPKTTH